MNHVRHANGLWGDFERLIVIARRQLREAEEVAAQIQYGRRRNNMRFSQVNAIEGTLIIGVACRYWFIEPGRRSEFIAVKFGVHCGEFVAVAEIVIPTHNRLVLPVTAMIEVRDKVSCNAAGPLPRAVRRRPEGLG